MDVAIVGGGLAGLSAALDLARAGRSVAVFDRDQGGGQVRTLQDRGFLVEEGAEGFVVSDEEVPALCRELGMGQHVIPQVERRSLLYRSGALTEMTSREAATLLGIPTPPDEAPGGLATLRDGMGSLARALRRSLGNAAPVHPGRAIERIEQRPDGWRLYAADTAVADARYLILAVPPGAAARLLAPLSPDTAALLGTIALASTLSVTLAYPRRAVAHSLAASGLVVAPEETSPGGLRACAFSSSKFPGRAPEGFVLLRAFFRPGPGEVQASDAEWLDRTTRVLGPALGLAEDPAGTWISRWPDAIPQYAAGHTALVADVVERLARLGQVQLAGAAYHPGGVPGAVRSGRAAARGVTAPLPTSRQSGL